MNHSVPLFEVPIRCATIVAILLALGGCSVLSVSSSLRVDVEVYKGPLAKEPELQLAEFEATWKEFKQSILLYRESVCGAIFEEILIPNHISPNREIPGKSKTDLLNECRAGRATFPLTDGKWADFSPSVCADYQYKRLVPQWHLPEATSCLYLAQVYAETNALDKIVNSIKQPTNERWEKSPENSSLKSSLKLSVAAKTYIAEVTAAATQAKLKAYLFAHSQISFPINGRLPRAVINNFSNLAGEYANQLTARADALMKQGRTEEATAFQRLPQSVYLRDSQPTDFLNLYIWNKAAAPPLWPDLISHPVESFNSDELTTRVRGYERLYGDNYWSRVNTVSANGDGKVAIALIKDDIGNWNLKSFDSDPSELLKAFSDGARALVKTAVEQVTAPGVGGSTALSFANRLAFGGASPADASPSPVPALHKQTMERLNAAYTDANKKEKDAVQQAADAKKLAESRLTDAAAKATPTAGMCVEKDLPAGDSLEEKIRTLAANILAGVDIARADAGQKGLDTTLAEPQWKAAATAATSVQKDLPSAAADDPDRKVLCTRGQAAKAKLDAGIAYATFSQKDGVRKQLRKNAIDDLKSILADHTRALMALSETAAGSRSGAGTDKPSGK